MELSESELKLDEQVHRFLETKQKLTYFLITASAVVIAFLFEFIASRLDTVGTLVWVVIASGLVGLLTAGASIGNLYMEMRSYKLHLRYRHQGRVWNDLDETEQAAWDRINGLASRLLDSGLAFLILEIMLAIGFFASFAYQNA